MPYDEKNFVSDAKKIDVSAKTREILKRYKEKTGISLQDIADNGNISVSAVSKYLSGETKTAGLETVLSIWNGMGLESHLFFQELFGVDPEAKMVDFVETVAKSDPEVTRLREEVKTLRDELTTRSNATDNNKRLIDNLSHNVDIIQAHNDEQVRQIREHYERERKLNLREKYVCFALLVVMVAILILLFWDFSNPHLGLFQRVAANAGYALNNVAL